MERLTGAFSHPTSSPTDTEAMTRLEKIETPKMVALTSAPVHRQVFKNKWFLALKEVFPLYFAVHLAAFVMTILVILINNPMYYQIHIPFYTLWQSWNHWDTGWYLNIAANGYPQIQSTAFFPLYPLLIRGLTFFIHNSLIPSLIISNVSGLVMLIVFYQLVQEDFDREQAQRTILYISLFPTAISFLVAYTESLFLCLALFSFYQMRNGQWWIAGLFGFFATLTRSAGVLLLLPFCYEYLRQHTFQLKKLRFDALAIVLFPAGIAAFSTYCYKTLGDPLAFSHAQINWNHYLAAPWIGIVGSIQAITNSKGILSYISITNFINVMPDLFILVLVILSIVGPWRFKRDYWAYTIIGIMFYIFPQLFPAHSTEYPIQSMARYMLAVFPAFIVLATLGKHRIVHYSYLLTAGASFISFLILFLMGHGII